MNTITNHGPHVESHEQRVATLSWPTFLVCLALLVVIFLVANPLWEPMDMQRMDENIWWSYYPIPLLVGLALAFERKWSWGGFAIETLRMTFVKFAVTFLIANVLWSFVGPPGLPDVPVVDRIADDPQGLFVPREPPAATSLDATQTGAVAGRVVDADGEPAVGAFVYVAGGLDERLVFEPPMETLELRHDGKLFHPSPVVVQMHRPVELITDDDVLHTVRAVRYATGRDLFNDAFPPGTRKTVSFQRDYGVVTLGCRVPGHDHSSTVVLVIPHPFGTLTDADGRFSLTGIPAGDVDIRAWRLDDEQARSIDARAAITPGGRSELQLELR